MEEVTHAEIAAEIRDVHKRIDDVEHRFSTFQEKIYHDVSRICENTQPIVEIGAALKTIQKAAVWLSAVAGAAAAIAAFVALIR